MFIFSLQDSTFRHLSLYNLIHTVYREPVKLKMTAVPDVEFKIQPCADALIAQSRPSNQLCEGMQAVFVRDILEVNKTGLQFYGLPHPLAAAKNTTINWIKQNSSHGAEKAFVFLQVTDKCVGFKKYDKLPPNYKLALPASAYLNCCNFLVKKVICLVNGKGWKRKWLPN